MALHLHVDSGLEALADRLASRLATVPADAFTPEVVVVPSDGVRVWLTHALAHRLGICANVRFVYPTRLIRDILGPAAALDRWQTGPLTWVVHSLLADDDVADALRARAIADLFDRYTLARPHMARRWSAGDTVGGTLGTLPEHQHWQPELWRRVQERLGGPSDAERFRTLVDDLQAGGLPPEVTLPPRVSMFSITSVQLPHLEVLAAVARHLDVDVYAPIVSPARWERIRAVVGEPLRHPVAREAGPVPRADHRLNRTWGRSAEEGHLLLLDAVTGAGSEGVVHPPTSSSAAPDSLLSHLQHAVATDTVPDGGVRHDHSIVWHRTFGPARQVEVLRDHLLHLLDERTAAGEPCFEPRDIVILTRDVETFAPIVESIFAGDPANGLAPIPVQVADRSLGADNPVATAGLALLGLLDGRFRIDEVVALLAHPFVAARFGLDAVGVDRLADLLVAANARWGLDAADQQRVLGTELGAFSIGDALDRLAVGAATAASGPDLGVGGVAPATDVVFDDLSVVGPAIEFLGVLQTAHERLSTPAPAPVWVSAFLDALGSLVAVPDERTILWRSVQRVVDDVHRAAELAGTTGLDTPVEPSEMAALVSAAISGSSTRPRFCTGRVTMSSLTALRGVPHRVVCLLGLDLGSEPGGFGGPDDLVSAAPCIGDRDVRSEYRAQMLDAVMSAGERLVITSTGFDVRTRAEIAPAVALSELLDAIGELLGHGLRPVDHPRQAWAESSFAPSPVAAGRPWSHDAGAARAALARRSQQGVVHDLPVLAAPDPEPLVAVADLRLSLTAPVRVFCQDRLGVYLRSDDHDEFDPLIPLTLGGLDRYAVRQQILDGVRAGSTVDDWGPFLRAAGDVPPVEFGDAAMQEGREAVQSLVDLLTQNGHTPQTIGTTLPISIPATAGRPSIEGEVNGVVVTDDSSTILDVRASLLKAAHVLDRIVDLVLARIAHPDRTWSAELYRYESDTPMLVRIDWVLPERAPDLLGLLLDQRANSLTTPVPFFPEVARYLAVDKQSSAETAWEGSDYLSGARTDPSNRMFFDIRRSEFGPQVLEAPVDRLWRVLLGSFSLMEIPLRVPGGRKKDKEWT